MKDEATSGDQFAESIYCWGETMRGDLPIYVEESNWKKNCIILIKVKKQIIDRESKDASSTIAWSHTGLRFRPVVVLFPIYQTPTEHSPEPRVMVVLSFHKKNNPLYLDQWLSCLFINKTIQWLSCHFIKTPFKWNNPLNLDQWLSCLFINTLFQWKIPRI